MGLKMQNIIAIELSSISGGCTCYINKKPVRHINTPDASQCIGGCCRGNGLPEGIDAQEFLGYSLDSSSYTMPNIIPCPKFNQKTPNFFPEEKGGKKPGFSPF